MHRDNRWKRSEPVDLTTKDHTFRYAVEALYPMSTGTIVARVSGDAADRTIPVVAHRPVPGAFTIIRKSGTTGGIVLRGLGREAPGVSWRPDYARGCALWADLQNTNFDTATPYVTCSATGAPSGLAKTGTVTYSATGFAGQRGVTLAGGRLMTPISATQPLAIGISGKAKPFLFCMALQWDTLAASKTIACWGNSAGSSARQSIETSNGTPHHRVVRQDTDGGSQNSTANDTITEGAPYLLTVLFTGRSVRIRMNRADILEAGLRNDPMIADRFVIGARLTAGATSQIAEITFGGIAAFHDMDIATLRDTVLPNIEDYALANWGV